MDDLKDTLSQLKNKGYRFSAVRNFIIESLNKNEYPLSVLDLQKLFKKSDLSADKVTLYREINFLKKKGIIIDVQLGDRKKYYEISSRKHHHHIICIKCKKINDFMVHENKKLINKALKQAGDFAEITNHSFEFFGLCKSCAKK